MQPENILNININDIIPNEYQPRNNFDEKKLSELALSIKEYGILNPILVRKKDNKYEIIAGERRYRAAKKIGLSEVPVRIKNISNKELSELALIENLHRENLNPIEEAKSYEDIIKLSNITQQELADKIGKSQSFVANKIRLLSLPRSIQNALINKQISERHARSLMKVTDEDYKQELLSRIIDEKLTVKELDNIIDEKEITQSEIKSAFDDIIKSLNIVDEKNKKEEKESDNMNGNFFPNYNNQQEANENASLNSMNMQSMNNTIATPGVIPTMTTQNISQGNTTTIPMDSQPVQEIYVPPIINQQPVPQQFDIPTINEQPLPENNLITNQIAPQTITNQQDLISPQSVTVEPLPTIPTSNVSQENTQLSSMNSQPTSDLTVPSMIDPPLFNPQLNNSQSPIIEPQINPLPEPISTQLVENTTNLYDIPINVPQMNNLPEEDNLTKVTNFLNQNNISYKSYTNETNKCIIIEL